MKMTKEERDTFVLNNHGKMTNDQLASTTGWAVTTIKSVKTRLGLIKKSQKRLDMEKYCLEKYPAEDAYTIAEVFSTKVDLVRDTLKALGIWESPSDIAKRELVGRLAGKFKILEHGLANEYSTIECEGCGHVIIRRTNNLTSNSVVCPSCDNTVDAIPTGKTYEYPDDEEYAHLYIAKVGTLVKIGVSKEPSSRLGAVVRSGSLGGFSILATHTTSRRLAVPIERGLLEELAEFKYSGPRFDGSTEVLNLPEEVLLKVLERPFWNHKN